MPHDRNTQGNKFLNLIQNFAAAFQFHRIRMAFLQESFCVFKRNLRVIIRMCGHVCNNKAFSHGLGNRHGVIKHMLHRHA